MEGLFSHYVANSSFATAMARQSETVLNTDDRNSVEFGFARSVGRFKGFDIPQLREAAHRRGADRPLSLGGTVDWRLVDEQNSAISLLLGQTPPTAYSFLEDGQRLRVEAETAYLDGNVARALQLWRSQPRDAHGPMENAMLGELLAAAIDEEVLTYIAKVRSSNSPEADMVLGLLRFSQGRLTEATDALESAFTACRSDPWPLPLLMKHSITVAEHIAAQNPSLAPRLFRALEEPFSVYAAESNRREALALIAAEIDRQPHGFSEFTRRTLSLFEPNVPWDRRFLQRRRDFYRAVTSRGREKQRGTSRILSPMSRRHWNPRPRAQIELRPPFGESLTWTNPVAPSF